MDFSNQLFACISSHYLKTLPQERKIPKINLHFSKALFEGLIFGGAYIRRGLSTECDLLLKIDWASLILVRKFNVFALFYCVFEGHFTTFISGEAI